MMTRTPADLEKILHNLIFSQRSSDADAEWFITQKHNADLCPAWTRNIETALAMFDRYVRGAHDIQGVRDRGVDVFVKLAHSGDDENPRLIGFQIKSYDDLNDKSWLRELKAQVTEARSWHLSHFYVVLATSVKSHRDKIRMINSEIGSQVTVVEPIYAYSFLHMSSTLMASCISLDLSDDDAVVLEARKSVQGLTAGQLAIAIELVVGTCCEGKYKYSTQAIWESSLVSETYRSTVDADGLKNWARENVQREDKPYRKFSDELSVMDTEVVIDALHGDAFELMEYPTRALRALALDALVRFKFEGTFLRTYLYHLLVRNSRVPQDV